MRMSYVSGSERSFPDGGTEWQRSRQRSRASLPHESVGCPPVAVRDIP